MWKPAILMLAVTIAACGGSVREDNVVPECAASADCAASEVCAQTQCVAAEGHKFRVTIKSTKIQNDGPGDAPDLFVSFKVNSSEVGQTPVVENSYEPVWNAPFEFEFHATATLTFDLKDARSASGVLIRRYVLTEPLTMARNGGFSLSEQDTGWGLEVSCTPL